MTNGFVKEGILHFSQDHGRSWIHGRIGAYSPVAGRCREGPAEAFPPLGRAYPSPQAQRDSSHSLLVRPGARLIGGVWGWPGYKGGQLHAVIVGTRGLWQTFASSSCAAQLLWPLASLSGGGSP